MTADRFRPGDRVRIRREVPGGNPRTPAYARGKSGIVTACHGRIENHLDHAGVYPPLYTVEFRLADLGGTPGPDRVTADIHEEWLETA